MSNARNEKKCNPLSACLHGLFSSTSTAPAQTVIKLPDKEPVPKEKEREIQSAEEFTLDESTNRAVQEPPSDSINNAIPYLDDLIYPNQSLIKVGDGNFGNVYKTHWRNQTIAIKSIRARPTPNSERYTDCLKEAEITLRLNHPNIIKCYGYCTSPHQRKDRVYFNLALQYIPGPALYDYIKDPIFKMDWKQRYEILQQVINALAYIHDSGVIHRDIKSGNILVAKGGKIYICDFGLAILSNQINIECSGTPEYMAPEAWRLQLNTPKMDIYSFGILMWEIAHWKLPWNDLARKNIPNVVLENKRETISPDCPLKLTKLIQNNWHDSPVYRFSSKEISQELSTSLDEISEKLQHAPQFASKI